MAHWDYYFNKKNKRSHAVNSCTIRHLKAAPSRAVETVAHKNKIKTNPENKMKMSNNATKCVTKQVLSNNNDIMIGILRLNR